MDSRNAIHTSSLAISLLRHSSLHSESFVLSPFSLNTALSILHDGADGTTQEELTNLLLTGHSPSDVTDYYSTLALSLSSPDQSGVSFKSATRFYVDDKISLKCEYQKHVEDKYHVKVENLNFSNKEESARKMNKFVEKATNGKIADMIKPEDIGSDLAILINCMHILAKWKHPFIEGFTYKSEFYAVNGAREMFFMKQTNIFHVNRDNEIGTALIMPYQDENYSFFYLMPNESSNLETMRMALTGETLVTLLKEAEDLYCCINVPKFKIDSKLDGVEILQKLGVGRVFSTKAELSKISSIPLHVTKIQHNVMIETDELGTEAAAATDIGFLSTGYTKNLPPFIDIDRPFIFGIRRENDILFIGQFA